MPSLLVQASLTRHRRLPKRHQNDRGSLRCSREIERFRCSRSRAWGVDYETGTTDLERVARE